MSGNDSEKKEYTDEVANLVIARIEGIPPNVSILIGGGNNSQEGYDIKKIVEHIKARDEIGKKIVDVQLAYIRSFKSPQRDAISSN